MNWYKKAQVSKKLIKNIDKKKQISIHNGWSLQEVEWAGKLSELLNNPSYFTWLLQQTRNGSADIQTGEDNEKIFDALQKLQVFKNKKMLSPQESDINKIQNFFELSQIVSKFENTQKEISNKEISQLNGAEIVYVEGPVSIIKVDTFEAGQQLFSDGWCVKSDKEIFYDSYSPPYYVFNLYNKPYALYCPKNKDFKDEHDGEMTFSKTMPLIDSLKYLQQNVPISKFMIEIINKEKEINGYAKENNLEQIKNLLNENLEYSSLIKNFNLTPDIIKIANNSFLERYKEEKTDIDKIIYFYNSIPSYLDKNKFLPKKNEIIKFQKELSSNLLFWKYIPKIFKITELKNTIYEEYKKLLLEDPSEWNYMIDEFKTPEFKNIAYEGYKKHLLKRPHEWNYMIDEFKTPEFKNIAYEGYKKELLELPFLWKNMTSEFKTPELKNTAYEGYKKYLLTHPSEWNEILDEFKTPELIQWYQNLQHPQYSQITSSNNWYKKAQTEFENPPEWDFPEADHDYNPNWDYEVDPIPDQKLVQIAEEAMSEINNKMTPQIGIGDCKVAYIKEEKEDALARYIYGTQPYPVFVVDLQNIKKIAEQCANDYNCDPEKEIRIGIKTSLYHELGHAIQEWMNVDMNEEEAERFATHYQDFGEVWRFWE
jgi:hypothetical protein